MEYWIGLFSGIAVAALGAFVGFDRERTFGATIVIVVAFYYVLFAVMGGSARALTDECLVAGGFTLLSVIGFRRNYWLIPISIAGHGVFDFFHGWFIDNPGMPVWWPGFCMTIDLFLGVWLAWLTRFKGRPVFSPSN